MLLNKYLTSQLNENTSTCLRITIEMMLCILSCLCIHVCSTIDYIRSVSAAAPARGRSHTSKSGSDSNEIYGYYDSRLYYGNQNISTTAFGSMFDECDAIEYGDQEMSTIHYVPLVVFPCLLLQGIVGNILAIPALVRVGRSAWSTVLYLACLGGTDLIILLIRCGDSWYQEIVRVSLSKKIIDSSDAACKTYYFLFMCIKHLNPWLMVAISVEMMIATRWPKRTYFMCTLDRARNVLMLIGIIIVCLDINHFWTFAVPKPGYPCIYTEEFSESFKDWVWPAMDAAVELILPLVSVSICFFLTANIMIQRPDHEKRDMDVEMKSYFLELATLTDFRTVCFILCLVFIFLNVCRITYTLTTLASLIGYIEVDCSTFKIFKTIEMTLTYLFYSGKIYLYIAYSSTFRAKLKEGFAKACTKFKSCCRIVCVCGYKWTPITSQDKQEDTRMLQSHERPQMDNEGSNGNSNNEFLPVRKTQNVSYNKNATLDQSKEIVRSKNKSQLADKRSQSQVRGGNQIEFTATNV